MANSFGMPKIKITFESLGLSAIRRSERGVALLILKDEGFSGKDKSFTYRSLAEVPGIMGPEYELVEVVTTDPDTGLETTEVVQQEVVPPYEFSETNQKYIRLAFAGEPWRLRVEVVDEIDRTLPDLLKSLELENFNYYSMPGQTPEDQDIILSWHKDVNLRKDKTIKFVGYEEPADHKRWINWTVPHVVYDGLRYEGAEFTAMLASIFAGLDLQRSGTYFEFWGKIEDAALPFVDDEDGAVNAGKLFLTYDGDNYKLSRAVNSLVTHTATVGEDQSKIRIVDAMDLIADDIRDTFSREYVGKILNTYENKEQFMALINRVYFPTLYNEVLEPTANNHVDIDMEAHRGWIITRGQEPDDMTATEIRTYNTGSNVFLTGRLSILDAMEDLVINFKLD